MIPTHIIFQHDDLVFKVPIEHIKHWEYRDEHGEECDYGSNLSIDVSFRSLFLQLMHEQLETQTTAEIEVMRESEGTPPSYENNENE